MSDAAAARGASSAAASGARAEHLRAQIAEVSKQIYDLETAYFAGTGGVEDSIIPLGPYKVVNKKGLLDVRREQRVFSLSAATAGGGAWPAAAHAPHELAAALAAGGVTPGHFVDAVDATAGAGTGAGAGNEAAQPRGKRPAAAPADAAPVRKRRE